MGTFGKLIYRTTLIYSIDFRFFYYVIGYCYHCYGKRWYADVPLGNYSLAGNVVGTEAEGGVDWLPGNEQRVH